MVRSRAVLAALLVVPSAGAWAGAADVTTSLRIGMIPRPEAILSKSDLEASGGRYLPLSSQRSVVPKDDISLGERPSHRFSLGGAEFTLRLDGKDFILAAPGGGSVKLKRSGPGFASVPVPIPEKRRYVLAFPATYMTAISFRSGSVQTTKIDGKDFAIYDDNLDGFYGTDDTFQVEKACVFAPVSRFFTTRSSVYEIGSIDREGGEVTYSRYSGDTGKLSMKYLSTGITAHVAFGSKDAGLNLVLLGRGKDAKVIPGSYSVLYGLACDRMMKKVYAGIVQGEFAPLEVSKDGEAAAEMGGPYRLDFEHKIAGGKITLSPSTIKLFGKNGERYVSFDIKGSPTVSVVSRGRVVQSERIPAT